MYKIIVAASLLGVLLTAGCRPTGTLMPMASPTSPLPTAVAPRGLPTATLEAPSSPISPPANPTSGLRLTATMGPTCPGPERPGQVCTKPYEGLFVVTDNSNAEVASATTDQNGQATIDLPPGVYTLTPKTEGRFPAGTPTTVTVLSGQYAEVNVELDTGIR
jgi:hypothetical protein